MTYVCLSDDCPNKHTFICHINDDKISYKQVDNFCSQLGVKNDLEAAHRVFELHPHWKYCDDELYVFDDSTGMWSSDEVIFMKIISKFTKELFVLNYNHKYKAWILSEKSYGNDVVMIKKIFPFIKTLCIDNL